MQATINFHFIDHSAIPTSFFLSAFFADTYDIFIDSGGSPDAYLSADINNFLNESFTFNGTIDANASVFSPENIIDRNSSTSTTTNATDENVAELVIMAVTSIVLGLMILITVIGNSHPSYLMPFPRLNLLNFDAVVWSKYRHRSKNETKILFLFFFTA